MPCPAAAVDALVAHTLLETFRVLTVNTALPALPPAMVLQALRSIRLPHVQLPPEQYLELLEQMAVAGRGGGAVYDA